MLIQLHESYQNCCSLFIFYSQVILCQLSQLVNPPSQIFLKFNKQIKQVLLPYLLQAWTKLIVCSEHPRLVTI